MADRKFSPLQEPLDEAAAAYALAYGTHEQVERGPLRRLFRRILKQQGRKAANQLMRDLAVYTRARFWRARYVV